jgi:hypothetical protein
MSNSFGNHGKKGEGPLAPTLSATEGSEQGKQGGPSAPSALQAASAKPTSTGAASLGRYAVEEEEEVLAGLLEQHHESAATRTGRAPIPATPAVASATWNLEKDGISIPTWNKHTGVELDLRRAETLAFFCPSHVSREALIKKVAIPEQDMEPLLNLFLSKGLIEKHPERDAYRLTSIGLNSVHTRTGSDRMGADGYAGLMDAQLKSATISLSEGLSTAKEWEQTLVNSMLTLPVDANPSARSAVAEIANARVSEMLAMCSERFLSGLEPPRHLKEIAAKFRARTPQESLNLVEPELQSIEASQQVADLAGTFTNDPKAAGDPDSYQEALQGPVSRTATQTAAMLGAMALSRHMGEGGLHPEAAARVAHILTQGREFSRRVDLEQILPASIAIKAMVHGGQGLNLAMSQHETRALLDDLARPVLLECRGDLPRAFDKLLAIAEDLGFPQQGKDREILGQNLLSLQRLDEDLGLMNQPFAIMAAEDQDPIARRHAMEEIMETTKTVPQFAGLLWLNTIMVESNLRRVRNATMAAMVLVNHPRLQPSPKDSKQEAEQKQAFLRQAQSVADTGNVYLRSVLLDPITPRELDIFENGDEQTPGFLKQENQGFSLLISELNGNSVGDDTPDTPWPDTFKEANMQAFKEITGLSKIRTALTSRMLERAWENEKEKREARQGLTGASPETSFPEMQVLKVGMPEAWTRDEMALAIARNADVLDPSGVSAVMFMEDGLLVTVEPETVEVAVAGARAHGGAVVICSLPEGEEVAKNLRAAIAKENIRVTRHLISEARYANAIMEIGAVGEEDISELESTLTSDQNYRTEG